MPDGDYTPTVAQVAHRRIGTSLGKIKESMIETVRGMKEAVLLKVSRKSRESKERAEMERAAAEEEEWQQQESVADAFGLEPSIAVPIPPPAASVTPLTVEVESNASFFNEATSVSQGANEFFCRQQQAAAEAKQKRLQGRLPQYLSEKEKKTAAKLKKRREEVRSILRGKWEKAQQQARAAAIEKEIERRQVAREEYRRKKAEKEKQNEQQTPENQSESAENQTGQLEYRQNSEHNEAKNAERPPMEISSANNTQIKHIRDGASTEISAPSHTDVTSLNENEFAAAVSNPSVSPQLSVKPESAPVAAVASESSPFDFPSADAHSSDKAAGRRRRALGNKATAVGKRRAVADIDDDFNGIGTQPDGSAHSSDLAKGLETESKVKAKKAEKSFVDDLFE